MGYEGLYEYKLFVSTMAVEIDCFLRKGMIAVGKPNLY
jgi:hypothetical protein